MTSPPATNLTTLPVELQLTILSYISIKDIQKCRRIDRHFHQLIDENLRHLIKQSWFLHKPARISSRPVRIATYFPLEKTDSTGLPIAFLEAATTFITQRGLSLTGFTAPHRISQWLIHQDLAAFWLQRCRAHFPPSHEWHIPDGTNVAWAMGMMAIVYLHIHNPELCPLKNIRPLVQYSQLISLPIACGVDTIAQVDAIEKKLRQMPDMLSGARIYDDGLPAKPDQAILLDVIVEEVHKTLRWEARNNFLADFLEIAAIPAGALFEYYARPGWMVKEFKKAMTAGEALGPIMKAAMAEEVVIF